MLGLALIAIGSGGIKPCVAAFGGDQFKLPEQIKQMATYFSLFYFAINSGSLISTSVTPILRQDVSCFDEDDCYSLAFGVPGVLMIVSISRLTTFQSYFLLFMRLCCSDFCVWKVFVQNYSSSWQYGCPGVEMHWGKYSRK